MDKKAGAVAKSIDQFADILSRNGIKNSKKIVDDAMFSKNGTGSMILDFLTRGRISNKTGYKNFQRKLADMDMRVGGKAYNVLDKRKSRLAKKIKNSLVQEHDILELMGKGDLPDRYLKVKTTGILNPVSKTKNTVFPLAGSIATANLLFNRKKEDGESNG